MIVIPAVNSANSIVVDANVIINLMNSDPTGSSLDLLILNGSTTYITDTVENELRNNLSNAKFYTYLTWAMYQHTMGEVMLVPTGIPADRNQGEYSMLWSVQNGFAGDGPHLMLSGDADARESFGAYDTANTMEYGNSLLLSGKVSLLRYYAFVAQITAVAPHEVIGPDGANFAFVPGFRGEVNGVSIFIGKAGLTINGVSVGLLQTFEIDPRTGAVTVDGPENCFGGQTLIDMWPQDPRLQPGADGTFDAAQLASGLWKKPIDQIVPGDLVVSFTAKGDLVPGRVTRTFRNDVKIILNFHGTLVTAGHVYYRPDSRKQPKFEPLIDILREDGLIETADGTQIRAATNVPLGDPADRFIWAVTGPRKPDGSVGPGDCGQLRLGTRFVTEDGTTGSIGDLVAMLGGQVTEDGLIRIGSGPDLPFHWTFGPTLPKPEDYVLACSGTTLADLYRVAEWESVLPGLPVPLVPEGGPVQPLSSTERQTLRRNEPLALADIKAAPPVMH